MNVGSVDEPRDGDLRPAWTELELEAGPGTGGARVHQHRCGFDLDRYRTNMHVAALALPPMWRA